MKENRYALMDDAVMDDTPNTHIKGTIERSGGRIDFWMAAPRPEGVSVDEWEKIQQAKWDTIFPKGGV